MPLPDYRLRASDQKQLLRPPILLVGSASVPSWKFAVLIRDGFSLSVRRATQECRESFEAAQQSCRRKDARSSGVNFPDSTLAEAAQTVHVIFDSPQTSRMSSDTDPYDFMDVYLHEPETIYESPSHSHPGSSGRSPRRTRSMFSSIFSSKSGLRIKSSSDSSLRRPLPWSGLSDGSYIRIGICGGDQASMTACSAKPRAK